MKFLSSDETEVGAAYMRAELESPRFRDDVLAGRRGWRIGGLFDGFPDELAWDRVALEPGEVLAIRYIDWDVWINASAGSRSAVDAAARIRAGEVEGLDAESLRPLAERLRSRDPPAELIAVTAHIRGPLVLVEGHVRLTAYALHPECLPPKLEILLGVSPLVAGWSGWGLGVGLRTSRGVLHVDEDEATDLATHIRRRSDRAAAYAADKLLRGISGGEPVEWSVSEKRVVHTAITRWRWEDRLLPLAIVALESDLARDLKLPPLGRRRPPRRQIDDD